MILSVRLASIDMKNTTSAIYFNECDLIKVIRLLEYNHIDYILSESNSDKICSIESLKIKQEDDFKKAFFLYLSLPIIKRKRQFNVGNKIALEKDIVSKAALRNHLRQRKSFISDTRGIDKTLDEVINSLIEQKFIIEVKNEKKLAKTKLYKLYNEKANPETELALFPIPCVIV